MFSRAMAEKLLHNLEQSEQSTVLSPHTQIVTLCIHSLRRSYLFLRSLQTQKFAKLEFIILCEASFAPPACVQQERAPKPKDSPQVRRDEGQEKSEGSWQ